MNQLTGSIEVVGKLTKLEELYVETSIIWDIGGKYTHYHQFRAQPKLKFTSFVRLTISSPSFAHPTLRRLNGNNFTGSVEALGKLKLKILCVAIVLF